MNTSEPILFPIALFVVVVLIGAALARRLVWSQIQRRLEVLQKRGAMTVEERLDLPLAQRTLLPLLDRAAQKVMRFTAVGRLGELERQLVQAGTERRWTAARFHTLSWLCAAASLILVPLYITLVNTLAGVAGQNRPLLVDQLLDPQMMLMGLIVAIIGYMMPRVELKRRIRQRQAEILQALPSTIDLMCIALEGGMAFDQALSCVRRETQGPLAEEFGTAYSEINFGRPRFEALTRLADRVNLEDVRLVVGAVLQSFRSGSSLLDTLRIQAEVVRVRQRQRVQEQVMKTPVKVLFPLVFFIFPTLMVVVLGPAVMRFFATAF